MTAGILILLAAIFKAVADTLAHHFDTSVFKGKNTAFWNPLHPDNDKVKKIGGYPLDAWHLANSAMIFSFILAAIFNDLPFLWWLQLIGFGVLFNLVFVLFYDKILR